MEKIEIKNFAGIKDITLEIKQINILIGPQASGKSVVAKLLFYFKSFILDIFTLANTSRGKRDLDNNFKKRFITYFPQDSWGKDNFTIRYYIEKEFIEVSRSVRAARKSSEVNLNYSDFYKNEFTELRKNIQKYSEKAEEDIQISRLFLDNLYDIQQLFLSKINDKLARVATFSQLYVPAGRSFFANLRSSIFTFLAENNSVDPFLVQFGKYYENIKKYNRLDKLRANTKSKHLIDEIASLNKKILCGKYSQEDGEDYFEMDGDRKISIGNSSSGQQETLTLSIILESAAFSNLKTSGNSIYIEEPEAHIFPAAQRDVVELISTVYNSRKESLQFLITTHSPYILTSFNNLLQAGSLAVNASDKTMKNIANYVPASRFLRPSEIAVYSLSGGYAQSILDLEIGLINTNIIDEVSNELAVQFDKLLDIDQ